MIGCKYAIVRRRQIQHAPTPWCRYSVPADRPGGTRWPLRVPVPFPPASRRVHRAARPIADASARLGATARFWPCREAFLLLSFSHSSLKSAGTPELPARADYRKYRRPNRLRTTPAVTIRHARLAFIPLSWLVILGRSALCGL